MARIDRVLAIPASGGYYTEDLAALQSGSIPLPERYTAAPMTDGFRAVREVAEAVSVGLVLDSGDVAWGDCVAVAYSGKAGRAPVFRAKDGITTIQQVVSPALQGCQITTFRQLAEEVDGLIESVAVAKPLSRPRGMTRRDLLAAPVRLWRSAQGPEEEKGPPVEWTTVERRLHTAVRYGVSQALLRAVALTRGVTMAEVVAEEWNLPQPDAPVPIHAQSGGERYHNADKMIARRVASLPHALVDDIPQQLGEDGGKLTQYVRWLKGRIQELGNSDYHPTIHLDVHGGLGVIFENNLGRVLGHLYALELAAQPYSLRVECPVMMESREAQIEAIRTLREYVRSRKMKVQLVVDEWANTVEAVLACKLGEVGAFLGGSCCETDLSAKVAVHVALATQPDMMMAKPGMGVDEGVMLVQNEMSRTLATIQAFGDGVVQD
jgi:methylaspartate ammonia-lyase